MGKWTAEKEVASLVARMNWTPNAATRARSLAVALVALCSLAVVIDKAVYTSRVELAVASDGGRCDDKCQVAWIQHLEVVKRKLAEEHKKPSLTPTKPLPHAKTATPTQRLITCDEPHTSRVLRSGLLQQRSPRLALPLKLLPQ